VRGAVVNRRRFLQFVAAGLAGAAVDVDKLLWQPGKKSIFDLGAHVAPTDVIANEVPFLLPGDIFTISGVWVRNPVTGREIIGQLQRFMTTALINGGESVDFKFIYPRPHRRLRRTDYVTPLTVGAVARVVG
jgi:hypothetical protein